MEPVFHIAPQPTHRDTNVEAIHSNVTVNASGDSTLNEVSSRIVELHMNLTGWSNGTSGTAIIQYTLTRVRSDGSEAGTVLGPLMSAIDFQKVHIEVGVYDRVKVSWALTGGTTSYPVMTTYLISDKGDVAIDARLQREVPKQQYVIFGDSFTSQRSVYWSLLGSTDDNIPDPVVSSGRLDMSYTDGVFSGNSASSRRLFAKKGDVVSFEAEMTFGPAGATMDPNTLVRFCGFGSGFAGVGFATDGSGFIYAYASDQGPQNTPNDFTIKKALVATRGDQMYRVKVVCDEQTASWYVDDMAVPLFVAAIRSRANPAKPLLPSQNDPIRPIFQTTILDTGGVIPGSHVWYIYACRVTSTNPDDLVGFLGRRMSASTPLATGTAANQPLLSISNPSANSFVVIRKISVMGASGAIATTHFRYRMVRNLAVGAGSLTKFTHWADPVRFGVPNYAVDSSDASTTNTGFGTPSIDGWAAQPGVQITIASAAGATNPAVLRVIDSQGIDEAIILFPGETLNMWADTNTTGWRHQAFIEWDEGYVP